MKDLLDVITIGDSIQDVFLEMDPTNVHLHRLRGESEELCLSYGAKVPVAAKHDTVGGNAANAAVAFARLGLNTAIYTHVGGDDAGERIRKEFKRNHVEGTYISVDRDTASSYNTVLSLGGERTILSYHIEREYRLPKLKSARWIYLSSMRQGCEVLYPHIAEYLERTGASLCFQPGTYQVKAGSSSIKALLKRVEVFVCNKEEAELYLGLPTKQAMPTLLSGIRALGPRIAVITDGRRGAYASSDEGTWQLDIIDGITRIDTTGAGDSFASGFVAGLASGLPIAEALRWGQAESSSVIQFFGAQVGLLQRRQLEQLLATYPGLQAKKVV